MFYLTSSRRFVNELSLRALHLDMPQLHRSRPARVVAIIAIMFELVKIETLHPPAVFKDALQHIYDRRFFIKGAFTLKLEFNIENGALRAPKCFLQMRDGMAALI